MKGWMEERERVLRAPACPQGCDSRPNTAARCSLSVYIMNSQQRRDRRAMNSWLQYQNTAAQVSQAIFISCRANPFIRVTKANCSKAEMFFNYLLGNILWDMDFLFLFLWNTLPSEENAPFLVCEISYSKTSRWCIVTRESCYENDFTLSDMQLQRAVILDVIGAFTGSLSRAAAWPCCRHKAFFI